MLRETTKIAHDKRVSDWIDLKKKLKDYSNNEAWTEAYNGFFWNRLDERYLTPIKVLQIHGNLNGEGYSIMTICCSLLEFLQSCYEGINYKYSSPDSDKYEYKDSSEIFQNFLKNQPPFKSEFTNELAKGFYKNVRCGLLHEARTKEDWIINAKSETKIVERQTDRIIVYRDNFYHALLEYAINYKYALLDSDEIKDAFIRKFNGICEI